MEVEARTSVGFLRIGELSKRTGVSPELLRAWERRYHVLQPTRSEGGFRLYSVDDEARVRAMKRHLASGISASEAARLALEAPGEMAPATDRPAIDEMCADLAIALDTFDGIGAQDTLDRLLATYSVEVVLREAVLPYLRELGRRWEEGEASVAQEHFASSLLRARLMSLARGWERGRGPQAVLACMPGEEHDLGLLVLGVTLFRLGWRVLYLGTNTPLEALIDEADTLQPKVVVLIGLVPERFAGMDGKLAELAASAPVVVAGAGADPGMEDRLAVTYLSEDPITAAERIAGLPKR